MKYRILSSAIFNYNVTRNMSQLVRKADFSNVVVEYSKKCEFGIV